jgi:monoamine oxidase
MNYSWPICFYHGLQAGKSKRGRRRSTGLRKQQQLENVIVEESFTLYASNKDKVGEGCYVSSTTSTNKRYYGVLVDQPSLKEASTMYFQDQRESLQLNERMHVLNQKFEKIGDIIRIDGMEHTTTGNVANFSESTIPDAGQVTNGHVAKGNFISGHDGPGTTVVNSNINSTSSDDLGITLGDLPQSKRPKLDRGREPDATLSSSQSQVTLVTVRPERPVQKFKYVNSIPSEGVRKKKEVDSGYRVLVATFCSIEEAAIGDKAKARSILIACEEGGNFLPDYKDDSYYYQYEVLPSSLACSESDSAKLDMMRTSMGFNSFLQNTILPPWFPLSNLHSQSKVLSMLNMKRDSKGNVKWDGGQLNDINDDVNIMAGGTKLSMQPRNSNQYQIGVIGGGIAGLACCQELVSKLFNDGIDAKVTLIEGRSRFGGRLLTDRSWKTEGNREFPIELGASWIHGIDHNPLAALAESAGINFVTASEEVRMLESGMKEVNVDMDERMGKLFDDLLDHAAEDCWLSAEAQQNRSILTSGKDSQAAVRWYASIFAQIEGENANSKDIFKVMNPKLVTPPSHRRSSDSSIDCAIGSAIAKHRFREFSKLTKNEHRMLLWNTKNVEYALGANISDLSMKYWDADDRHAFEGDHVLLKEGYSSVVDHMVESLHQSGSARFEYILNFPAGKVDYGRKSTTQAFGRDRFGRERHLTELSDSCSVTSEDGSQTKYFDFVVCAVPLGVLKESVERHHDAPPSNKISFSPSLPFSKIDAISNVGFGLLNKVYLHFDSAFWRVEGVLREEDPLQCLFGNVSGVNPHHYMFFDVGKLLGSKGDHPAIIMSLVSGKEAVALECLSDSQIVDDVMITLRLLFSNMRLPDPKDYKISRWGKDRFSRGSYTFLPPGATDQDFHLLQSPVNANGDSLLLEGSEVMRLFFAGEHTTALHPSMAHGAMLSGIRAAHEVISAVKGTNTDDRDIDKVIPLALFRHLNPSTSTQCNLCHKYGSHIREGSLLAFKRGARQVLVHNNCAEFSPEVEVVESKWKNVIRAVNRGKAFSCVLCSLPGATIGCSSENCYRMYHFACAEDSGWRFDRDGKHFFCDLHSTKAFTNLVTESDRVSISYFLSKNPGMSPGKIACSLCRMPDDIVFGQMLAFENGKKHILCVHEKCINFTNLVDTSEKEESRISHEYNNVFQAVEESRICCSCRAPGASILCSHPNCDEVYHFHCGLDSGWKFERDTRFLCKAHRLTNSNMNDIAVAIDDDKAHNDRGTSSSGTSGGGVNFKHNLLSVFGASANSSFRMDVPGNLDIGGTAEPDLGHDSPEKSQPLDFDSDSEGSFHDVNELGLEIMDISLSHEILGPKQLVRLERPSLDELWNLSLKVEEIDGRKVVSVASAPSSSTDSLSLEVEDVVVSINGSKIGSDGLKTLRDVLFHLKQEIDLFLQVIRRDK